jgi:hypothetical protein
MKKLCLFLILSLFATAQSGCGLFDSLDEMGERQEEARDATQMLFNYQRQGTSSKGRADILICMKDPICNPGILSKIKDAVRYYWAAEFQLWMNYMDDRWQRRLELFNSSMRIFYPDMKGFIINGDYKTIDPTKLKDPRRQSLAAFAYSMDQVNIHQRKAAARAGGGKPYSILDLMESGLEARERIRNGYEEDEYKHEVVSNEEISIYMLRLRYNMKTALVATQLGDLDRGGKFKVIYNLLKIIAKSFTGGSWTPDLTKSNSEEFKKWNKDLRDAIDTRDFLRSIGEEAKLHWKVKKIYKTLKLPKDGHDHFTDFEYKRYQEFLELKENIMKNW